MTGETNLEKLIQNMKPEINKGEYVFCTIKDEKQLAEIKPLGTFLEKEGTTLILSKTQADELSLPYSLVCAWITLNVHSSLEAVGLTAAVSKALTEANISCNVVAAYYHDHIFVPINDAERAMEVLQNLSRAKS